MNLVITGSSSGIGRALAEHLLQQDHRVWGVARSDQTEFAAQHPANFVASKCDISDWTQAAALASAITAAWSHIDGVVACAGVQGEMGLATTVDPLRWSTTVRLNVDATFFAFRALHPLLAKTSRRAKFVAFSGGGATKARTHFSAYAVAKTGVVRLIETIAEELRAEPIDLNAIAPGAINTRLTEEVLALGPNIVGPAEFALAQKQKASGGASLEKVFGLVDWLLSNQSDGISGKLLAAPWDPWDKLGAHTADLTSTDIYTLRRILPEERGKKF